MAENKDTPQEETIFTASDFSLQKYDKHVKNARTALYVVSGLLVLGGIIGTIWGQEELILDIWIEVVVMAGIFLVLGIWSTMKPFTALLIGLIIYVLYQLLYIILEPSNIAKGLILKVAIVIYLVRGMSNAREAEEWKKTLKK